MNKNVMIVEDDWANMMLFNDLLVYAGYATSQVWDGTKALAAVRMERPALVLMDIQLPNVSGLDVTKAIKRDEGLRSIPVIAVTAFVMKGDKEELKRAGCDQYVSKPISTRHLLEIVGEYLS